MFNRSKTRPERSDDAVDVMPLAAPAAASDTGNARAGQVFQATQKPSVISEGLVMRGDVESNGILHVEGGLVGTVKVGSANVGASGFIEGQLTCQRLTIKGRFDGLLICDELVVAASARITGQLSYRYITISSGAQVDAEVEWRQAEAA